MKKKNIILVSLSCAVVATGLAIGTRYLAPGRALCLKAKSEVERYSLLERQLILRADEITSHGVVFGTMLNNGTLNRVSIRNRDEILKNLSTEFAKAHLSVESFEHVGAAPLPTPVPAEDLLQTEALSVFDTWNIETKDLLSLHRWKVVVKRKVESTTTLVAWKKWKNEFHSTSNVAFRVVDESATQDGMQLEIETAMLVPMDTPKRTTPDLTTLVTQLTNWEKETTHLPKPLSSKQCISSHLIYLSKIQKQSESPKTSLDSKQTSLDRRAWMIRASEQASEFLSGGNFAKK